MNPTGRTPKNLTPRGEIKAGKNIGDVLGGIIKTPFPSPPPKPK